MAFARNGQLPATSQARPSALSPQKSSNPVTLPHASLICKAPLLRAERTEPFRILNPQACRLRMRSGRSQQTALGRKYEKRSVNSFMAFRSFYKPIFPKLQQKDASTFLTTMWKSEPFKAKWTIIAKAYSIIRDAAGKHRAPLVSYLTLVCPKMGIIEGEEYFGKMNWGFETTADGTKVLKQTILPDLSCFETHILYTNMTPKDIIHFCAEMAYIPQQIAIQIAGVDLSNSAGTSQMTRVPQQDLLASYPIIPQPDLSANMLEEGAICSSAIDSRFAATSFEVVPVSYNGNGGYQWTGSMCDLYNPAEGSTDLDSMLRNQEAFLWEGASICIPQSFESPVQDTGVCERYVYPSVPNGEAQNHFGRSEENF